MLPTILSVNDNRTSIQAEKAANEIATMLNSYANVSGTSEEARKSALSASSDLMKAAGKSAQILEISHDLWTQYRKREGQPLDQFITRSVGVEVDESGPLDFLPCVNTNSGGGYSCVI